MERAVRHTLDQFSARGGRAGRHGFRSFWMGGCEATETRRADEEFRRLKEHGIRTVRAGFGWRRIERSGRFDFDRAQAVAESARARGLQVIWTLCDEGWPDDVDPMSRGFALRFARYAAQAARFLRRHTEGAPVYVPVNEPSYLAWSACGGRGDECTRRLRRQLAQAAILACEAILDVDARARFVHTDPLLHLVPPDGRPDLAAACARGFEDQFYCWDVVTGHAEPGLGGGTRYADYLGINYYAANQVDLHSGKPLAWHLDDPRRARLSGLLLSVHERYGLPLLVSETGHHGVLRGHWLREVAEEVRVARDAGVPVEGVCLYPEVPRRPQPAPAATAPAPALTVAATSEAPRSPAHMSSQYSTAPGKSARITDASRHPRATA
jgi:hypothetical protein